MVGAALHLWDCHDGSSQRWTFAPDGTWRVMGLCATVDGAPGNGADLIVAGCDASSARFTLSTGSDLVHRDADRCVDVRDWSSSNGARLQLWDCAGSANQKWHRVT